MSDLMHIPVFECTVVNDREIHVVGVDDQITHSLTDDCICGPIVMITAEGTVIAHPTLDGREIDTVNGIDTPTTAW